jgi:hypothetical protein
VIAAAGRWAGEQFGHLTINYGGAAMKNLAHHESAVMDGDHEDYLPEYIDIR